MPWGDGGLGAHVAPSGKGGFGSGGLVVAPATGAKATAPVRAAIPGLRGQGAITPGNPGAPQRGFFDRLAHGIASQASKAGHDLEALPAGLTSTAQFAVSPFVSAYDRVTGNAKGADKAIAQAKQYERGTVAQVKHTMTNPGADLLQTLLLALPAAHGLGRIAEPLVGVDRSVPRVLRQGEATVGMPPRSANRAVSVGQHLYDKALQSALTKNDAGTAGGRVANRVAAHAAKRVAGQIAESERPRQAMRATLADDLEHAGKQLRGRLGNHSFSNQRLSQLALQLTSENSTAQEAAHFHAIKAAQGIAPKANLRLAKLYRQMHTQEMLVKDVHGNVTVNAAKFPRLAAVDEKLAAAQKAGADIIHEHGLMTDEGARARIDAPGIVRRGGVGEPVGSDAALQKRLAAIEGDYNSLIEGAKSGKAGDYKRLTAIQNGRLGRYGYEPVSEQLRAHAEKNILDTMRNNPEHPAVKAWTAKLAEADALRAELTRRQEAQSGLFEPTSASGRPVGGRGYATHQVIEKRSPRSPVARATGPVVGEPRSPIGSKAFKGEAMAQGKIPANVTGLAAQHLRDLIRYTNTSELRKRWAETGSDTRRSPRDILVKVPGEKAGKLTSEQEAMLGKGKLTAGADEAQQASLREFVNHLVPGANEARIRAWEKAHEIGEKAPAGYRWVDENTLGDLKNVFQASRGRPGRAFDNINSAITAQTVYYKIGHVGTRALTNAALNLTEGSLKHSPESFRLWKQLSPRDRFRAYAAAGQHGFAAMPHEGVGAIGRTAARGANFWAHRFDSPFRFNSIAYQAAKAGYKTPAEFRSFLDKLEHPEGLDPIQRVKVENVAKLTNRENISYDRLSERERRFLARGLWFYPWVKGSSAWAMRAALEHPFKGAIAGQAMQQGRAQQAKALGDLPSYEYGLMPLGANRVTNLNTFNPAGTLGSLLQIPEFASAAENLNPASSMLLHLATRTNQYGNHSNKPITDALIAALSPTPEFQIGHALAGGKPSKMFPTGNSALAAFLRMLVGPAMPRNVDTGVLHSSAARERAGR